MLKHGVEPECEEDPGVVGGAASRALDRQDGVVKGRQIKLKTVVPDNAYDVIDINEVINGPGREQGMTIGFEITWLGAWIVGHDVVCSCATSRVTPTLTRHATGPYPLDFFTGSEDEALIADLHRLKAEHPRWGYRKIWKLLRNEGLEVNRKRVERLWRQEGLQVVRRPGKKKAPGSTDNACHIRKAKAVNQAWSVDFVQDQTVEGRRLKILTVIDE